MPQVRNSSSRVGIADPKKPVATLELTDSSTAQPSKLTSKNGPEFIGPAIREWIAKSAIATVLIDPSKPRRNRTNQTFNGRLPDECLSVE